MQLLQTLEGSFSASSTPDFDREHHFQGFLEVYLNEHVYFSAPLQSQHFVIVRLILNKTSMDIFLFF